MPDNLPQERREALPAVKALTFLTELRNAFSSEIQEREDAVAIAIGILACEQNYRVSFRTAAGLIDEMVVARKEDRLGLYLRQFKKMSPDPRMNSGMSHSTSPARNCFFSCWQRDTRR